MSEPQFIEETHTYLVNGERVPSITQVLREMSVMSRLDPAMLREARDKGRRVHKAIDFYCKGQLDETSVDEVDLPYLRAWKRFVADFQYEDHLGETPFASEKWGYAGTPDRLGRIKDKRRRPRALVEVKSGAPDPVHGPQTAAQLELLRENDLVARGEHVDRLVVRVQANGFYQIDRLSEEADWSHFVAALTVYRFRERHGLA